MVTNYDELSRRQQENYQRSRDPFEYGQQVARRRYSEIMSGLDAQRQSVQQSYGDMYQQARQRAIGAQAMGGPTLSGGMGQQRRDFVSAMEMQELGKIGQARDKQLRDLYTQGQAAFSNAQLEGQQATQMDLSNRTAALGLVQQQQAIMDNKKLTPEQKQQQLDALGGTVQGIEAKNEAVSNQLLGFAGDVAVKGGYSLAALGTLKQAGLAAKAGTAALTKVGATWSVGSGFAGTVGAKTALGKLAVKAGVSAVGKKVAVGAALKATGLKGAIALGGGLKAGLGILAMANPVGAAVVGLVGLAAIVGVGFALFGG